MDEFITLTCPSCGAKLQITEDVDRFVCSSCRNEHIVNRSGGVFTLRAVLDGISRVQEGIDKTSAELAIARIKEEINQLGKPIKYTEAVLAILSVPSRKAAFMKAYNYIRGTQLSIYEKSSKKSTEKEEQKIFSELNFNDLVKLNGYFTNRHISDDERIVSYILRKMINSSIREGKLRELAKYQDVLRK